MSPLGQLLDTAYAIEYGADSEDQSALNLLYLLAFQPSPHELAVFGESDEKFHIRGGNQQLPKAMAAALPGTVKTGHKLAKIRETAAGRYRLWFERGPGTVEVVADWVVLAVPFAVLGTVDFAQAGFDALKLQAIAEQGRGHNGKLQVQLRQRRWLGAGPWPGKANGSSYSDTGYQVSWEATRAQSGVPGILVLYSGGSVTDAMRTTQPFATAADAKVRHDAETGLVQPPGLSRSRVERQGDAVAPQEPVLPRVVLLLQARPVHDVRRLRGRAPGRRALCRRAHVHRLSGLHGGRRRARPAGGQRAGGSHLGDDPTARASPGNEHG